MCCAGRAGLRGPRRDAASEGDATHPLLAVGLVIGVFEWETGKLAENLPEKGRSKPTFKLSKLVDTAALAAHRSQQIAIGP